MGFSRQEYWSGWPFPPPVDHALSEQFTMTFLSWVSLYFIAHDFTELCKPLPHENPVIYEGDKLHTQLFHYFHVRRIQLVILEGDML